MRLFTASTAHTLEQTAAFGKACLMKLLALAQQNPTLFAMVSVMALTQGAEALALPGQNNYNWHTTVPAFKEIPAWEKPVTEPFYTHCYGDGAGHINCGL